VGPTERIDVFIRPCTSSKTTCTGTPTGERYEATLFDADGRRVGHHLAVCTLISGGLETCRNVETLLKGSVTMFWPYRPNGYHVDYNLFSFGSVSDGTGEYAHVSGAGWFAWNGTDYFFALHLATPAPRA
jgi:hypothetical protein